ncbi:peptidoglycan-binding domain-containing protein [Agromyces larvae]|uniref:Peptidoglycan-binding protein n=1 Tax=Agromyces larvae TaxID=2929802 RepID=A0ABY4BU04_9MICO|nr:peptidoglycan-binding domain-containing protein [Agromyces larvae]UOE42682.1 peptidoglycan-binding protein [Agromyces larvae]
MGRTLVEAGRDDDVERSPQFRGESPAAASARTADEGAGLRPAASMTDAATRPVLQRLQRTAGNQATAAIVVARQSVEEEPAGPGSLGQAPESGPTQLPGVTTGPVTGGAGAGGAGAEGPAAPQRPMLRRGSVGPSVGELQTKLNERGAEPPLAVDGIFGPLTDAAVRAFQTQQAIGVDGIVGPITWGRLDAGPGPEPEPDPEPEPEADPLDGICTIEGHGSSPAAVAQARVQALELYGGIAPENRTRMEADPITIDVIPHDRKLTELAPYAHLAGTQTFDGRIWDDVRGIQTEVNGVRRVAIAEEDLVSVPGTAASYGPGFLAAHEGGHGLQFSALTPAQVTQLTALHAARLAASGPITQTTPAGAATDLWLDPAWYSAANKEEYFANSVAAYLGHPYSTADATVAKYNQGWLQANDPGMFTLLQQVYASGGTP